MAHSSTVKFFFLFCLILIPTYSCRENISKPAIGDSISTPIHLASDPSGNYFYVLNSDFLHKYSDGSILVLDSNGAKVGAVPIPRLGKVLSVSDSNLFVSFDHNSGDTDTVTMLFDISDPKKPVEAAKWTLPKCTPVNVVSRSGSDYFAVSCQEGDLYMGIVSTNKANSTLTKVRSYPQVIGTARRAMYLDTNRRLLFLFITDMGTGSFIDKIEADQQTWVNNKKTGDQPDEIPDNLQQSNIRARDSLKNTTQWQFMLYDFGSELDQNNGAFPSTPKNFEDVRDTEARWLYFKLNNYEGSPDSLDLAGDTSQKYYRTNFWDAQPDPDDSNSFYLSHRGLGRVGKSENANDLVKVTFIAGSDPRAKGGVVPKLTDYFTFTRVYGFKGDETGKDKYFSPFLITRLSGYKVVLLNSFRDLSNFKDPRYTLSAANLIENLDVPPLWFTQVSSTDIDTSYYHLALANNGNLLTISFFDESLELFNVKFGEDMRFVRSID